MLSKQKILTALTIILSVSFFTLGPLVVQETHAQSDGSTYASALAEGAAEGIGTCLGAVGAELLAGVIGGGANPVNYAVSGIPVYNLSSNLVESGNIMSRSLRENCMDGILYAMAQSVLDQVLEDTLVWVESGFSRFGQPGNRGRVSDLGSFLASVGDQAFNRFTGELARNSEVCGSFREEVLLGVQGSYYQYEQTNTGIPPSGELSSSDLPESPEPCGLEQAIGEDSAGEFFQGNFKEGGWEAFEYSVENPNANPVGAYLNQNQRLTARVQQARRLDLEELQQNNGWMDEVACPETGDLNTDTGLCSNGQEPAVQTPGPVVEETINNVVGSDFRRLEAADEVNEIVGALANQLVSKITGIGASGSSGGFYSDAALESDGLGNLDSYSQGQNGFRGQLPEEYLGRELSDQLKLEKTILGNVERLPDKSKVEELARSVNQCLVNNNFQSDTHDDSQKAEELLEEIMFAYQNVLPIEGETGSRDIQDAFDAFDVPEVNGSLSDGDVSSSGSASDRFGADSNNGGPLKIDWAENPRDWQRGTSYGNPACDQGEYKIDDINEDSGKGLGNISFNYSSETNEWEGYICGKEGFDDPLTGKDSIHVELYSLEEYVERGDDLTFNYYNGSEAGNNLDEYFNTDGYKLEDTGRTKVDWRGAEYDWQYYNLFADREQLLMLNRHTWAPGNRYTMNAPYRGTGGDPYRYGAQVCREQIEGEISWIVKPGDDHWTKQECREYDVPNDNNKNYYFLDAGETRDAFKDNDAGPNQIQDYITILEELIGDNEHDSKTITAVFTNAQSTDPTNFRPDRQDIGDTQQETTTKTIDVFDPDHPNFDEPDSIRELIHDFENIDTEGSIPVIGTAESGQVNNLADRKDLIDGRFGRMESRFHTEGDLEAAENAVDVFNPATSGPLTDLLELAEKSENNCDLPDDWELPDLDIEDEEDDDDGGGDGDGDGDDDGDNDGDDGNGDDDDGDGDGDGDDSDQDITAESIISVFEAEWVEENEHENDNLIRINWETETENCFADSNPQVEGWTGPVGPLGTRYATTESSTRLTLSCEVDGTTVSKTLVVYPGETIESSR